MILNFLGVSPSHAPQKSLKNPYKIKGMVRAIPGEHNLTEIAPYSATLGYISPIRRGLEQ